eukprot:m.131802 g.131802  ORF g.131802 m.131802 type:complete len:71 (+) comp13077_c4_seq3:1230-1442(+)
MEDGKRPEQETEQDEEQKETEKEQEETPTRRYKLKKQLRRNVHYILVGENALKELLSLYGGGPILPHSVN